MTVATPLDATAPPPKRVGIVRSFLCDEGFRNATYKGQEGYEVQVRLTSYRSLPLSCVEGLTLKVDGQEVSAENITFIMNGYSHSISELPQLSSIWWFILDTATLFVAHEGGLSAGVHEVEGTLITVEPYITAGRFSFYNSAKKSLQLEQE